ncbi:MAG: hypothetical protein KC483_11320 [Nitrosarchaeum sp.]|nr:hypothetical protein [Nitrosarchaeum sp.]
MNSEVLLFNAQMIQERIIERLHILETKDIPKAEYVKFEKLRDDVYSLIKRYLGDEE